MWQWSLRFHIQKLWSNIYVTNKITIRGKLGSGGGDIIIIIVVVVVVVVVAAAVVVLAVVPMI
jgi:hypothetical protein